MPNPERNDMPKVADKDDARGWYLYFRDREKQWELTYRTAPGKWRKHRVPRSVGAEPAAEKYAAVYVATKRKQGFPAPPPPKREGARS